jgi:hypothetical protein
MIGNVIQRRNLQYVLSAVLLIVCSGASAQDEYLRVFTERHFEGESSVFTPAADYPDLESFDNRISSVIYKIPPGRVCILFVDKRFDGPTLELPGTGYPVQISDLGLYDHNITSLRWDATGGEITNQTGAFVRLYEKESFKGRRLTITFNQNVQNLRDLVGDDGERGFDNSIASSRWLIPGGWNLVLYKNRNFDGDAIELRGSGKMEESSTLGKFVGRASSLRWEPARFPVAPGGPPSVISKP